MVHPISWLMQVWMTLSEWEKEGRRFGKRQCILRKVSTGVEWCDATKYYLLSHVICYLVKEGREKWKEEWRDRGRRKKGKIRKDERGRKGRAGKGKKKYTRLSDIPIWRKLYENESQNEADTIGEFPLEPLLYVGKDQVNIDVFHTSRIRWSQATRGPREEHCSS